MIADLKPHSKYKELGVPWLGSLPTHWEIRRAKFLFREMDQRSDTGKEELLSVSHLTGVTPRSQKTITMFLAKSNVGHKICRPNDLVINTMWAWMGALGVAKHTGLVSPAYGVYRPLNCGDILPRYADYLLRARIYVAEYQRRSTGVNSSRLRLYPESFLRIEVVIPPPNEQTGIVRLLDWANGRLDRAIRAKRKVIALLNEQKQTIIHRAVTRGVDRSTSYKSAGMNWLEEVPGHWRDPIKIKYISSLKGRLGWQGLKASEYSDYGPYVVSSAHYKNQKIQWEKCPRVSEARYELDKNIQLREADILLMKDGAAMGKLAFVDKLPGQACLNSHLLVFRPLVKDGAKSYDAKFLFYFMLTKAFQDYVQVNGTGSTFLGISQESLGNYKICLPPIDDQRQIVRVLDNATARQDKAIELVEKEITLLREYRTRLTSDVVTGKLDVREAAARLPDAEPDIPGVDEAEPDSEEADEEVLA